MLFWKNPFNNFFAWLNRGLTRARPYILHRPSSFYIAFYFALPAFLEKQLGDRQECR